MDRWPEPRDANAKKGETGVHKKGLHVRIEWK